MRRQASRSQLQPLLEATYLRRLTSDLHFSRRLANSGQSPWVRMMDTALAIAASLHGRLIRSRAARCVFRLRLTQAGTIARRVSVAGPRAAFQRAAEYRAYRLISGQRRIATIPMIVPEAARCNGSSTAQRRTATRQHQRHQRTRVTVMMRSTGVAALQVAEEMSNRVQEDFSRTSHSTN